MVGAQSPPTLPPLTSHNMNLSTMIDNSLPTHPVPIHPLPSPSSALLHSNQLPPVSAHLTHNQPVQFRSQPTTHHPPFSSLPTLTSTPLPKLPPLSSQLAPIPTTSVSQPIYHDTPLSSIQPALPYSTPDRPVSQLPASSHPQLTSLALTQSQPSQAPVHHLSQHPHQLSTFQQSSVITTDPSRFPAPSPMSEHSKFLPTNFHDGASRVTRSERIAPLSLPLPATKSVYSDAHGIPFDPTTQPTVSPVSVAQTSDTVYCVSPVSTSQPSDYSLPTGQSVMHSGTQRRPGIDDSLIARLRGFSGPNPPAGPTVAAISRGEPQIRDTSESLAIGYVDNLPGRDCAQIAAQSDAVTVSPDRPHACRKCSATFRRRDNLMAHIRAQHKGERPFKCEVCGFRFIKKDHAMKHWKVVHLKERPFVCTRCNSRFGQRSDLNKHVRSVHLRIKPFECEHCGLRFSHRGNQIRHQAVVHEKKKPFTCPECSSSFAEKSNLLKHCQAVHKSGVTFSS